MENRFPTYNSKAEYDAAKDSLPIPYVATYPSDTDGKTVVVYANVDGTNESEVIATAELTNLINSLSEDFDGFKSETNTKLAELDEKINGKQNIKIIEIPVQGGVPIAGNVEYRTEINIPKDIYSLSFDGDNVLSNTNIYFYNSKGPVYFNPEMGNRNNYISTSNMSVYGKLSFEDDVTYVTLYGGTPSANGILKFTFNAGKVTEGIIDTIEELKTEISNIDEELDKSIKVTPQTLSLKEKEQSRINIDTPSTSDIDKQIGYFRIGSVNVLSATEWIIIKNIDIPIGKTVKIKVTAENTNWTRLDILDQNIWADSHNKIDNVVADKWYSLTVKDYNITAIKVFPISGFTPGIITVEIKGDEGFRFSDVLSLNSSNFSKEQKQTLRENIDAASEVDFEVVRKEVEGKHKDTLVSIPVAKATESETTTKTLCTIEPGSYWVDCESGDMLTNISYGMVYAYYEDGTFAFLGNLSAARNEHWQSELIEITFEKTVTAIGIYHQAHAFTKAGNIILHFVDMNPILSTKEEANIQKKQSAPKYQSFNGRKTILTGNPLFLDKCYIQKNAILEAEINGSIESVSIGVGYSSTAAFHRTYTAQWILLTPTSLEFWYDDNGVNKKRGETINHGLTLDEHTKISIRNVQGNKSMRIITKLGDEYVNTSFDWNGSGTAFIENNGNTELDCYLNFIPGDLLKKIWIFGDSYCGINNSARWMTQLLSYGCNNFLLNAVGGEAAREAYFNLKNLLSLGACPTYIFWAMGMNGEGDSNPTTISDYQKLWLHRFLRVCKENGIVPILATIPSVKKLGHHGLSAYIRNSGYRYVDFADAVGSQEDGTWYDGLVSEDEIHPSITGARVLVQRLLRDFPEISV